MSLPLAMGLKKREDAISIGPHRSNVTDRFEFNQRRELLDRKAADDHLCGLRIENNFKAELLELSHGLRRFVCEPDLDLGLAVANELGFIGGRLTFSIRS